LGAPEAEQYKGARPSASVPSSKSRVNPSISPSCIARVLCGMVTRRPCLSYPPQAVDYEETGWYDGEVFVKPPEVLTRDRLLGMYEVFSVYLLQACHSACSFGLVCEERVCTAVSMLMLRAYVCGEGKLQSCGSGCAHRIQSTTQQESCINRSSQQVTLPSAGDS